jgi:signal transduction histidine kinase/DNA-binding response OmpR family regulator
MKWHKMSVSQQLKISLGLMALFVLLLGAFGIWQSWEIFKGGETLYNHPLQIRRAVSTVKHEVTYINMSLRDMLLAEDDKERDLAYERLLASESMASQNFGIIKTLYLGPQQDVQSAITAYSVFTSHLNQVVDMIQNNQEEMARENLQSYGVFEKHHANLVESIRIIDDFAKVKADQLYDDSRDMLVKMAILNISVILLLLLLSYYISKKLYSNIKGPLDNLNLAFTRVQEGDLKIRSDIESENEFGHLSSGFNNMIETIEKNVNVNKSGSVLANIMMMEDEVKPFFKSLLSGLLSEINGNLGAAYLLSNDGKSYDFLISIGMQDTFRHSFDAESLEGELGLALSSDQIQIIRSIDKNSYMILPTSTGHILPKEIMTIPVTNMERTIAVMTVASVEGFNSESIDLVENIMDMLKARTQGVLNYHMINRLREELQLTNRELEMQTSELQAQEVELKEQNRELERQKDELMEVSRLKTNFLSNMSHELRTPLNSVIALSGVLERKLKDRMTDEEKSFIEVIGRSGKNLLEMINDILDISRIESGKVDLLSEAFSLNGLIGEVLQVVKPLADEKNINLIHEKKDQDLTVISDTQKVRHIVQNLLGNAVKFTEAGFVSISARIDNNHFTIEVLDTGIGISQNDIKHIFDEFRQADGSTTRRFGGTGLGLAITKKYSEFLGGNIQVESLLGQGSKFIVTLPILKPSEGENEKIEKVYSTIPREGISESKHGKKLLIVEDSDPAIVQILDILQEDEYSISIARDGMEAIQILKAMIPDGIILDLMMPNIDGFEVLQALRENKRTENVPVLVLTAKHIEKDELAKLKKNHIHQLIQKGNVDPEMLREAVLSMLCPPCRKETVKTVRHIPSKRPTVLIVEDNPDNRLTARALLQDDFNVVEAEDGEEALELVKEHLPDIILMDIALPGMDGVEAFRIIRKTPTLAHIPIIALTASAMTTDREIFLAHGFDAFIPKPIIENQFLGIIQRVLYGE